jgi:uncharacterized protein (DUF433 family)
MKKNATRKILSRYIVVDPKICHGKPTFRGTRIMVADVLEQVAEGLTWKKIIKEWRGSINNEAIAEAVSLARQAFLEKESPLALTKANYWEGFDVGNSEDFGEEVKRTVQNKPLMKFLKDRRKASKGKSKSLEEVENELGLT